MLYILTAFLSSFAPLPFHHFYIIWKWNLAQFLLFVAIPKPPKRTNTKQRWKMLWNYGSRKTRKEKLSLIIWLTKIEIFFCERADEEKNNPNIHSTIDRRVIKMKERRKLSLTVISSSCHANSTLFDLENHHSTHVCDLKAIDDGERYLKHQTKVWKKL